MTQKGSAVDSERRSDESVTAFTLRRVRNEILEHAARVVLEERVSEMDSTDVSYNMALTHAAEAVLRMRT